MIAASGQQRREPARLDSRLGLVLLAGALGMLLASATSSQPRERTWERFGPRLDEQDFAQLQIGPPRPRPPPPGGARYHPRYGRWWPGQTLPADAPATVLADPARFHLRPAPPGYTWLLCDGDLLLASSASGLIVEVIPAGAY